MRARPIVLCAALVVAVALGGGCAHGPVPVTAQGVGSAAAAGDTIAIRCERALAALDRATDAAGVGDAEAARIAGFAWLRVDRLLASIAPPTDDTARFAAWVQELARLDAEARLVEIANLPVDRTASLRQELAADGLAPLAPAALLAGCADVLGARDLATAAGRESLRAAAVVPDDYDDALRFFGAYPLAALPFAAGVRRLEDETRAAYALPLPALPVRGRLERYVPRAAAPLAPADVRAVLAHASANPLRIPAPDAIERDALLASFAPVLVVDEFDADDRIGRPRWAAGEAIDVDTAQPVLFARTALTRVGDDVLLQLVYAAWFPARRASHALDPLAGRLDALVWRVTLAPDGVPLLYDSIHACGCYQLFFPTKRLALRTLPPSLDEGALAPQAPVALPPGARIELRIESGSHYLRRVGIAPESAVAGEPRLYGLAPEASLRTLPRAEGGTRSLYAPDGLVPGTERAERFVFWPMGIASAGAMRQWGRHATAFVGRRHFDEATLIERYFVLVPAPGAGHP
jgi:hypothetical protein